MDWQRSDPIEFHTVEGLDALKQKIGSIRDGTQFGTPERVMANNVYHAVKNEIGKQAPDYIKVMKDYEEASKLIEDVERSLSLGEKAAADTSFRKLTSVLRNNVNTNFGSRQKSLQALVDQGADELIPAIAGQSSTSVVPRGIQGANTATLGGLAVMTGNPQMVPMLAATSPRVMGEAVHMGGRAAGAVEPATRMAADLAGRVPSQATMGALQMGRLQEEIERLKREGRL